MPRAIWKGVISFGMVSIPIRLFPATESKDIGFRQLRRDTNTRVRMLRWDPVEEQEVPYEEIVKGYEYAKDRYVIVDDEDLEKLPLPTKHTIELTAFVEEAEIDPVHYEKSYYLSPEDAGIKPYSLLIRAMQAKGLIAIAKVAIRTKERLCALRARGDQLILETLYYPDEIRDPGESVAVDEVSEEEMEMARALIEMLEEPFDPEKYKDQYREALMTIINAKLEGQEIATPEAAAPQPAVDLMAALRASVEAAMARKEGESAPAADNGAMADEKAAVAAE
ncbi:MAG: Ku protein [Dehalococcoidia bacterium]|nr:Ku protein [Dehalococcoidia bacterium]MYD29729.1 Ku protein [Dehalococcoidia bacterium]